MTDSANKLPAGHAGAYRFASKAMGTTFEVLIAADDADYARQLAAEAFKELSRLEHELSRFIPSSSVAQINRLGAGETLRIGVPAYECLQVAARAWVETGGCFDVTVGSLLSVWMDEAESPRTPSEAELARARRQAGMRLLKIHEDENAVTVMADGVIVDLGGIGKGYALDMMAGLLKEWGAASALLHGGQSTALAVGKGPDGGWPVALRAPGSRAESLGSVRLQDRALSGSGTALHGPHMIDPRTGRPATAHVAAWALADSAARADALSTAFMVMSDQEVERYCTGHPDAAAIVLREDDGERVLQRFGRWD